MRFRWRAEETQADLRRIDREREPNSPSVGVTAPSERAPASSIVLSSREERLAKLLIRGDSNVEIAKELSIAPRTVKNNINGMYGRFNVHSRTELVIFLLNSGLAIDKAR